MSTEITCEEWSAFTSVVVKVLEGHQDPNFIETVSLRLSVDVLNQYRHWKTSLEGSNASSDCAKKVRYVLNTWKSIQTNLDLSYLLQEFDQKLSEEKLANELRTRVKSHFSYIEKGIGKLHFLNKLIN